MYINILLFPPKKNHENIGISISIRIESALTKQNHHENNAFRGTGPEPNPPIWPSSVHVFDPTSTDIEAVVQAAYALNGGHEPGQMHLPGGWGGHR